MTRKKFYSFIRSFGSIGAAIAVSLLFITACVENSEEPTLGEEYIDSQTNLISVDSFTVDFSTIIFDALITSNSGTILVGNYSDDVFGKISSKSYFQLDIPSYYDIETIDRYDSLQLVLNYGSYSFGDTTKTQKLYVHQLREKLEYEEGVIIHSNVSLDYNPTPIGSIEFKPEDRNSADTLAIKIDDEIGLDLFTKLRDNNESISSIDNFISYFYGLVLVADEESNSNITAFIATDDMVKMRLFTTRETLPEVELFYDFDLYDDTKQFNEITHDFTSTPLSSLVEQETPLPSSETDGLVYLQGGTGVAIKVKFPTISDLLLYERGAIIDAKLFITPKENSYGTIPLPEELATYTADIFNRVDESIGSSSLDVDELYQENTVYTFDLTSYINERVEAGYFDPTDSIIITLSTDDALGTTFNRLIVDMKNLKTKLRIYYLTY